MLMKKIMAEIALRSSWRETKGQRTQLMTTALTVPTRKAKPRTVVMATGDCWPVPLYMARDMTVKDMHPAMPERCACQPMNLVECRTLLTGWELSVKRYIIGIMKTRANAAMTNGLPS